MFNGCTWTGNSPKFSKASPVPVPFPILMLGRRWWHRSWQTCPDVQFETLPPQTDAQARREPTSLSAYLVIKVTEQHDKQKTHTGPLIAAFDPI
ncbi:hypothetical protein PoB_006867700 [Plakobranchus ocellatus]|uniref:Uncharacterized protein n=1 Tax=Plakobranchus ocellatus TaxID=259542 RepID=A0AAV4DDQ5_9GAST|nr:hypothetical protein PoB_006867700 [Plakobranchus ocellatus]